MDRKSHLPAKTEPVKTIEAVKVSNPESGQSYEYTKTTTVTQVPEPAKETIPAPAAVKQTRVSADDFQYRLAKPTALFPNRRTFQDHPGSDGRHRAGQSHPSAAQPL